MLGIKPTNHERGSWYTNHQPVNRRDHLMKTCSTRSKRRDQNLSDNHKTNDKRNALIKHIKHDGQQLSWQKLIGVDGTLEG